MWGVLREMPGFKDQNIEVFVNFHGTWAFPRNRSQNPDVEQSVSQNLTNVATFLIFQHKALVRRAHIKICVVFDFDSPTHPLPKMFQNLFSQGRSTFVGFASFFNIFFGKKLKSRK